MFTTAWESKMQLKRETPVRGKIQVASALPNLPPTVTSVAVTSSVAVMTHSPFFYAGRGSCLDP